MSKIGYGYGSEWHLLRYLGYHRDRLDSEVIRQAVPNAASIEWLDFVWSGKSTKLRWDMEWQGIGFLAARKHNSPQITSAWAQFWPQTGTPPCWDAIGLARINGDYEWLLVEAKAHTAELEGNGCCAGVSSRRTIINAFHATQAAIGITPTSPQLLDAWLGAYYQYANRLAVLNFLHTQHISAHLINIYFIKEARDTWNCPQRAADWDIALDALYNTLRLPSRKSMNKPALMQHVHEVFLPVYP